MVRGVDALGHRRRLVLDEIDQCVGGNHVFHSPPTLLSGRVPKAVRNASSSVAASSKAFRARSEAVPRPEGTECITAGQRSEVGIFHRLGRVRNRV